MLGTSVKVMDRQLPGYKRFGAPGGFVVAENVSRIVAVRQALFSESPKTVSSSRSSAK